jgi:hypothetical protein
MQVIYKYPIKMRPGHNYLKLNKGYKILKLDYDPNKILCIWALVDNEIEEKKEVDITLVGTGWPLDINPEVATYIDSVVDGPYVWHAFEVKFNEIAS